MDAKQSLEIIEEMIQNARGKFHKSDGLYYLFWGYLSLFILLSFVTLSVYFPEIAHFIWAGFVLGFPVNIWIRKKAKEEKRITTQLDKVIGAIWKGFGLSALVLLVASLELKSYTPPLFLLLIGFALLINGVILKFKPLQYGGLLCLGGSLISIFYSENLFSLMVFAVCITFGYLIPGHMLRNDA